MVYGKKRSKERHFAFYSNEFSTKSIVFDTEFEPVYDWSSDHFNLIGKKVTCGYFSNYNTVYNVSKLFVEHHAFQTSVDKCYDGMVLKVESK
jgi:hypothetical protein